MAEDGKELKTGPKVRMASTPVEAGKGLQLLKELHSFTDASELARYYGTVLLAYLRTMLESKPLPKASEDLGRVVNHCTGQLLPSRRGRAASRGGCAIRPGRHRRRAGQPPGHHRLAGPPSTRRVPTSAPGTDGKATYSERLPGMGKSRCYLASTTTLNADGTADQLADAA